MLKLCCLRLHNTPFTVTVSSERKLIEFYTAEQLMIDPPETLTMGVVAILRRFHGVMLDTVSPRAVIAEGKCMYRAASLALYGEEFYHNYLRLITAMEIMTHNPRGLYPRQVLPRYKVLKNN
jgi:hypothetical protein